MIETDPYLVPGGRPLRRVRRTVWVAFGLGALHLVYRAAFTIGDGALDAAVLLVMAEILALVVFALRSDAAWNDPTVMVDLPEAPTPATTVVVDASGASVAAVRTTLVSCRRLRGVERVIVADPLDRAEVRTVAQRLGATVEPSVATSIVATTVSPWALLVRAGDLPLPDALEMLATACSSPDVGVVQLGVEEANPSSFEHDPDAGWSLGAYEHQVVRPSLASAGSIPWYGDGPAMVRPVAIRDAADTTVSMVELGLHALEGGYRVTLVPRTLARTLGPRSLAERLRRHHTHTAPVRTLALGRRRPPELRRAFRSSLADPLAAVERCLLVAVAVLALGFGRSPLETDTPWVVAVLAGAAYGSRALAQSWLGRGRLGRASLLHNGFRTMGVDLGFGRSLGGPLVSERLALVWVALVAVVAVSAVQAVAAWQGWAGRLAADTAAVALALAAGFVCVAADVAFDAAMRRQRRDNHRVRIGLVAARLDGFDGQLHDLSVGGCAMVVVGERDDRPQIGDEMVALFRIPDADGVWRDVVTPTRVAHVAVVGDRELRVGLAFLDPVAAALDPVVEFLTIDRRLVALGRRAGASGDDSWLSAFDGRA